MLLIGINISLASYVHIPYGDFKSFLIYGLHFCALQFTIFGFVYILTLHKYLFYIIFIPLFFIFSLAAFWVYSQDITIDSGVVQVTLESKPDVITELISLPFLLFILWTCFTSYLCIIFFKRIKISTLKSPVGILAIIGILTYFVGENYRFGVFKRRLPYNIVNAVKKYNEKPDVTYTSVPSGIISKTDSLNVIFVLGETVRADHLSINGYHRKTTPLLERHKNLISFPNIYTPLTYTAISVPQILTNQSVKDSVPNNPVMMYSVLNSAKIQTEWIGNQSLEKSYEAIVNTNTKVNLIDKFHSVLSQRKKQDYDLLLSFDKEERKALQITTLHMIGSHWFYDNRYNVKKFEPTAKSKFLKSSTKEELINSYDNTICYLDLFMNDLIASKKNKDVPTICIYLSDHGESLGENGHWFHAQGEDVCKNPAMMVWYSKKFKEKYPLKIESLKRNQFKKFTTDFLFHSILDLFEIKHFEYLESESIFKEKK